MRAILLLLLLAAFTPKEPYFVARWDTATSSTVQWTAVERSCLSRESATFEKVFISCYERPGTYTITFGASGPLSGELRPKTHDTYILVTNGEVWRAPLVGRPVYMAAWR